MKALKENCQKHTDGVVDADTYEQRENVRKLEAEGIRVYAGGVRKAEKYNYGMGDCF